MSYRRTRQNSGSWDERLNRRIGADETEVALESLINGVSLLKASWKWQNNCSYRAVKRRRINDESGPLYVRRVPGLGAGVGGVSEIGDGNLADSELDPWGDQDVDEALPDLLEHVQQALQAIKLNESQGS
ncbi:hypothetical protein BG015_003198 [Linnemannia schmuckeri]|uniref:Uncharacterized protein n=1 Tax=Linnemannia schmuckeri TaxID=64567 RepID=A0A9P5RQQ8_9FUNG|nr:hypothetical protein BG015_003198 [Linnemannia schmuckeri]